MTLGDMMQRKKKPSNVVLLWVFAIGLVVLAVLFGIWLFRTPYLLERILYVVGLVLSLFVGGVLIYILTLDSSGVDNFFLYDSTTKKSMQEEDLTFEHVAARLSLYMPLAAPETAKSSSADCFRVKQIDAEMPEAFQPLYVPYFFWLAAQEEEISWFYQLEKGTLDNLEAALIEIKAERMSGRLQYLYAIGKEESERLQEHFKRERADLEKAMLDYVKQHIDAF